MREDRDGSGGSCARNGHTNLAYHIRTREGCCQFGCCSRPPRDHSCLGGARKGLRSSTVPRLSTGLGAGPILLTRSKVSLRKVAHTVHAILGSDPSRITEASCLPQTWEIGSDMAPLLKSTLELLSVLKLPQE
mmetsp:Transcript_76572/g.135067  ORF Transcript_76572/g.135067 Transcript_76572/m.135067 type:complete len:133 (+) Transcript_76572:1354-1752(+)